MLRVEKCDEVQGVGGTACLLVLLLAGCYSTRSTVADDDRTSTESPAVAGIAGSSAAPGVPAMPEPTGKPSPDAGATSDPRPVPPASPVADHEVLLSAEQATCLSLNHPPCAGCHGIHGGGLIVLRPEGAPPHPPGTEAGDRRLLMRCGLAD